MSDPYLTQILNEYKEKQDKEYNWIEQKLKKILPKEEDLKDISKVMLAHNIVCLKDELEEITNERDILYSENERLTEENNNLEILLKGKDGKDSSK